MKTVLKRFVLIALALTLAACGAAGPKYKEMSATMPTVKPGEGRIFFFRSSSMFGAAVSADIRLNGEVVGRSMNGNFFYVDRPAGNYLAAASTETEKSLSFTLNGNETKYVRSSVSLGAFVGRVNLDLETPEKAQAEIETLEYHDGLAKEGDNAPEK